MSLDPAWVALIGTVFGGVGLKVLDHYLGKNKTKVDDASRMRDELRIDRDELRIEINTQKTEIDKLEIARNEWQAKYLDLRDQLTALQTELTLALAKIDGSTQQARNKIQDSK